MRRKTLTFYSHIRFPNPLESNLIRLIIRYSLFIKKQSKWVFRNPLLSS